SGRVAFGAFPNTSAGHIFSFGAGGSSENIMRVMNTSNAGNSIIDIFRNNAVNVMSLGTAGATLTSSIFHNAATIEAKENYPLRLAYDDTVKIELTTGGEVKINTLSGTGTRMVVADNAGELGTQAIPDTTSLSNRINLKLDI